MEEGTESLEPHLATPLNMHCMRTRENYVRDVLKCCNTRSSSATPQYPRASYSKKEGFVRTPRTPPGYTPGLLVTRSAALFPKLPDVIEPALRLRVVRGDRGRAKQTNKQKNK